MNFKSFLENIDPNQLKQKQKDQLSSFEKDNEDEQKNQNQKNEIMNTNKRKKELRDKLKNAGIDDPYGLLDDE